ncbi:MAG: hypothetical protein JW862_04360, partial [Anaerolineales bacterium]|nr:hypothetical protein [Anaerolineales bacterium]
EELVRIDPEYLPAQEALVQLGRRLEVRQWPQAAGSVQALGGRLHAKTTLPAWSQTLYQVRKALAHNDLPTAEEKIHTAFAADPDNPLTAISHLRLLWQQNSVPVLTLARHYQERWPDCLAFSLILADALMSSGASDEGVALLHRAATQDLTAQVARRLWGPEHPYQNLWPRKPETVIEVAIPAGVAAALGWNMLGAGENYPAETNNLPPWETSSPETLKATTQAKSPDASTVEKPHPVERELAKIGRRLHQSELAESDGRFPVYVVFSTRRGLQRQYGRGTTAMLDAQLRQLIGALRRRLDWGAILVYGDDAEGLAEFGLEAAPSDDPWALKLLLADLDKALARRGAMIGALLIVGGPQVVPFHRLPNPTDDLDVDVPSDNPYASRDENYFVPEWPVGRLPGVNGPDPGLLISCLRTMTASYASAPLHRPSWLERLWHWLQTRFNKRLRSQASFGYSAEVWQRASLSVFQPIGEGPNLLTSPPLEASQPAGANLHGRLGYFNLHGLRDQAEWYGQRDPSNGQPGEDYPVALRPQDVVNGGRAPQVVFSEACYGGHVIGKQIETALALKFLASGSRAVVGSTVISYGSISPPLNAADLLARFFWQELKAGSPAGEALRRAKILLAQEMHSRQGYLDGEDQKTLISFVLYGDPLASADIFANQQQLAAKSVQRPGKQVQFEVKTVCDKADQPGSSDPIPQEVIRQVKQVVETYLPGMRDAQVSMSHEHVDCNCQGHECLCSQLGPKARPEQAPQRRVVTLSKTIQRANLQHPSYARLTLDAEGKVVKLAVSR